VLLSTTAGPIVGKVVTGGLFLAMANLRVGNSSVRSAVLTDGLPRGGEKYIVLGVLFF
jgi:hypothetical protein